MILTMKLRDEAMLMLDKRGSVLDTARRVSTLMQENNIKGAIIGGVAVVLHGHIRTTKDVDVLIQQALSSFQSVLESAGADFNRRKREFILDSIPIHLVDQKMIQPLRQRTIVIEEVTTVSLADLINMKLRSGISNIARAQDIADVIGLIKSKNLTGAFAAKIEKSLRAEFRKLIKAVNQ